MSYQVEMPHWPPVPVGPLPGDPLARTLELLSRLGDPHTKLPPVIHVAGTNGKGSTVAILRAMLEAAGYRVHVYTSPHLIRFNERIRLAGRLIDDETLHMTIEEARIAAGDMPINVFEGTTAAAFLAFSRVPADIMLVECGMGGRFDATNVIPKPRLSIIAPISRDHMDYLGNDLKGIAWHKAGIMRMDVVCVASYQMLEVMEMLRKEAKEIGTPLYEYSVHWKVGKSENGFLFADAHGTVELPPPALLGDHQLLNAGCAIAAISLLEEFDVRQEHVLEGLQHVEWPGRLECIVEGPMAGRLKEGFELWYDGGHNEACAAAIRSICERWVQEKPLYFIIGTTRGKELVPLLSQFTGLASATVAVPVQAEPKCYMPKEVADAARAAGHLEVKEMASVEKAIEYIMENFPSGRILVFGSLFFRIELIR